MSFPTRDMLDGMTAMTERNSIMQALLERRPDLEPGITAPDDKPMFIFELPEGGRLVIAKATSPKRVMMWVVAEPTDDEPRMHELGTTAAILDFIDERIPRTR